MDQTRSDKVNAKQAPDEKDWSVAFDNVGHVSGSDKFPLNWAEQAQAYRDGDVQIDTISYGEHEREQFDLVHPAGVSKGLALFVHGGYWMRLDRSFFTHLARGARAKGWTVCIPSYPLAPEVRVSSITRRVSAALTKAASLVDGPIRLSGHSAGGQLVSRMLCHDTLLSNEVLNRIEHTLSISGVHDLRPLLRTKINETLGLDMHEASNESVTLLRPFAPMAFTAWVGGAELTEFIRQAKLIVDIWEGLDAKTKLVIDPEHNHFTVIEALHSPDSAITRAFVG